MNLKCSLQHFAMFSKLHESTFPVIRDLLFYVLLKHVESTVRFHQPKNKKKLLRAWWRRKSSGAPGAWVGWRNVQKSCEENHLGMYKTRRFWATNLVVFRMVHKIAKSVTAIECESRFSHGFIAGFIGPWDLGCFWNHLSCKRKTKAGLKSTHFENLQHVEMTEIFGNLKEVSVVPYRPMAWRMVMPSVGVDKSTDFPFGWVVHD